MVTMNLNCNITLIHPCILPLFNYFSSTNRELNYDCQILEHKNPTQS